MVYIMEFYVDGGCRRRRNGSPTAIGAAACCLMTRDRGSYLSMSVHLPSNSRPTNSRAEIIAIILALEWALRRHQELNSNPRLDVRIHSDSTYAIGCVETWISQWRRNGWTTSDGKAVANRDLIERASDVGDQVKELGSVRYEWVSRSDNQLADRLCNDALDEQDRP